MYLYTHVDKLCTQSTKVKNQQHRYNQTIFEKNYNNGYGSERFIRLNVLYNNRKSSNCTTEI